MACYHRRMKPAVLIHTIWCSLLAVSTAGCEDPAAPEQGEAPQASAARDRRGVSAASEWQALDRPAAPGSLGPSLTSSPDGVLGTWVEPFDGGHRVRFAWLRGDRWSAPRTVLASDALVANWADFPRAARAEDGAVYVSYLRRSSAEVGHAYDLGLARAPSASDAFVDLGLVHDDGTISEHGFVSLVPEGSGVRVFWLDGRATGSGGATRLYGALVGDEVGEAEVVDDRTCDCCQTDAAAGPSGPLVAFRDRDATEVRDVYLSRRVAGAHLEAAPVHRDGWQIAGCPVNGPALDAEGQRVAVAWFTGADGGSVKVAFSTDGGATFRTPIVVDAEQPPGRVDVALLDDGAVVSWLARSSDGGEARARFVSSAGALGAPTMIARMDTGRSSGFPVLARDGDRLLVAYRDGAEPPRVHVEARSVSSLPRDPAPTPAAPVQPRVTVGAALPRAVVRVAEGDEQALASFAEGRPLLVAFFARWCQPCRQELATLEWARERWAEDLEVLAVSLAEGEAIYMWLRLDEGAVARAEAVARRWGFRGRVVADAGAAGALGVPPLPALIVVDGTGHVRSVRSGEVITRDELSEIATEL